MINPNDITNYEHIDKIQSITDQQIAKRNKEAELYLYLQIYTEINKAKEFGNWYCYINTYLLSDTVKEFFINEGFTLSNPIEKIR